MTLAFRPWLPDNTTAPRLALGAVAEMVDAWSSEWFAGEPMRASGVFSRLAEARAELRKNDWHVCNGGLAVGVSPTAIVALGAQILGIPASGFAQRPSDLALLEQVGGTCFDDLKRRASVLFGLAREASWHVSEGSGRDGDPVYRLEISGVARTVVVTIELSAALFSTFVKAKIPPAPAPSPFGTPEEAIAMIPIHLSAALGGCNISIAELTGLVAGDVLMLDRSLDAPLPLAVNGAILDRGACTVTEAGDGLVFKISQAPIG